MRKRPLFHYALMCIYAQRVRLSPHNCILATRLGVMFVPTYMGRWSNRVAETLANHLFNPVSQMFGPMIERDVRRCEGA